MNEKNADEIRYRRLAFRLFDKEKPAAEILKRIPRSRTWLFKWKKRFEQKRWRALDSLSKAPKRPAKRYDQRVIHLVLRLRKRLHRVEVGLSGARAIRRELRTHRLVRTVPALSTLNRWLKAAGLIAGDDAKAKPPFYPAPASGCDFAFSTCDWTARYLEGGEKVFVFHPIDAHTHALAQSSSRDKTTTSVCGHLLQACACVGVPDCLQLDNDAAFTGLGKTPGGFGRFVRLALYLGIELIFIPPGEPKRNYLVEGVHHLWAQSFWRKNHFASVKALQRKSPQFLAWYEDYAPPALQGLTVREARKGIKRRKLPPRAIKHLPPEVPLTAGRWHFIRRVTERGVISIRKEDWKVSRQLAGEYVWATLDLRRERLEIYHRRSEKAKAKVVKKHRYPIVERVQRLQPEYRRRARRVRVLRII
jgi:putative transposase